jgi:hypothetical protein
LLAVLISRSNSFGLGGEDDAFGQLAAARPGGWPDVEGYGIDDDGALRAAYLSDDCDWLVLVLAEAGTYAQGIEVAAVYTLGEGRLLAVHLHHSLARKPA